MRVGTAKDGAARVTEILSADEMAMLDRLYAEQAHAIDGGEAEAWAETFTANGCFASPSHGAPVSGRAALTAFARDSHAGNGRRQIRHWLNNLVMRREGDDAARVTAYALIVAIDPGSAPVMLRSVVFDDRLTRSAGGWRIEHRAVSVDPPDVS